MTVFLKAWLDEARKLGLPWWQLAALILAAALISVTGKAAWEALRKIEWKVEPAPEPVSDGGTAADRDRPPAQEGGGPAGGGPTGGSG